ncbi:unnamed protein product [Heligmosomoides polygyrus]|uniref:DNA helicase n=1 Tax=Heligmosomoides polygyrus TaxID=6339 RepID=A0A183GNX3_HELPZ|nr:unnamed protein product [Heligmosomoides polygyrus]
MLVNVCGVISDWESHLSRFVRDNIEKKLLQDPRCEVAFDRAVSPVHTLRVSSSFPGECIVRTMLFANVSMPLLSRMLGMVAQSKSALVLCIYSVTISYVPPAESTMDGCLLPLGVCPRTYPNCTVEEASLHDDFMKYNCILIPDPTSTSSAEWYFVLDVKSLG